MALLPSPSVFPVLALALLSAGAVAAQYRSYPEPDHVRCESHEGRVAFCPLDTRGGVMLVRQHSRAPCIEGQSWGVDRRGVWVAEGCRAEFESAGWRSWPGDGGYGDGRGPRHGRGWGGGYGYGEGYWYGASPSRVVRCESHEGRLAWCPVGRVRDIRVHRQLSRAACHEGHSWGWDRGNLWVDRGCRAEFALW
ncbi:DUF3011 domain-containing protein [Silanimonas lenta]|uniref:DUF3011 domain-containing protein n=1 Tax=Silanimonas lenta TaxID=265429 RepID=UPI000417B6F3|nr:DUF3011 domain-containing protein [Silanimonas lenta]